MQNLVITRTRLVSNWMEFRIWRDKIDMQKAELTFGSSLRYGVHSQIVGLIELNGYPYLERYAYAMVNEWLVPLFHHL